MSIFKDLIKRTLSTSPSQVASTETPIAAGTLQWTCNICGAANQGLAKDMDRETGPCSQCGAVMRFRTLAAILTLRLFGEVKVLSDLTPDQSITGIGMSDAECYANVLA